MKVITFSRNYPATHPRKGEPTYFVEKILIALIEAGEISMSKALEIGRQLNLPGFENMNELRNVEFKPKWHTIRGGCRWKVGDQFSPRVWTGKPYASKQLQFAPEIEIRQIYNFQIIFQSTYDFHIFLNGFKLSDIQDVAEIAKNDGLSFVDFFKWFGIKEGAKPFHFAGQILCWNPDIDYSFQNI